jgi:fermentation-respiration switch protein FrsA (DUF1100 family)
MKIVLVVVAVVVTMVLLMVVFERSLIFFPTRHPTGRWDASAMAGSLGCEVEDCDYLAADGVRLHSWWVERHDPAAADDPVLLFFHGNAGNLSDRAEFAAALAREVPARVLLAGYRGYGRSEGRPSEEGLAKDALAAWQVATETRGVPAERVIIFGKSLGGAVAVRLADEVSPAGLIVESSFTSIPDMARQHYPFVPRALIRTEMDSLGRIGGISCPKLFVHSRDDEIVPYAMGERLFEAASQPKRFFELSGAGHNETWLVGGGTYMKVIREFVVEATGSRRQETGRTTKKP